MKNTYNKGTFRSFENGKISSYLKTYGNKKWRRTEKSEVENQLRETVKFFKQRKKRRKLIWVKITKEIYGKTHSYYRSFYSEKSFKDSINRTKVKRYFLINKQTKNEHIYRYWH